MKPIASIFKIVIVVALLFCTSGDRIAVGIASAAEPTKPAFCSAAANRHFDFWVGDCSVFDVGDPTTKIARVQVERILNGCALQEHYAGADGLERQSRSVFDASRNT